MIIDTIIMSIYYLTIQKHYSTSNAFVVEVDDQIETK